LSHICHPRRFRGRDWERSEDNPGKKIAITQELGVVRQVYDPSYMGGRGQRATVQSQLGQKCKTLSKNKPLAKRTAEVGEGSSGRALA
jgi:hypothetical protein